MSAKINCPRKHQPRLCQLSVPRMGLIVVWCTNNGWRRRSTCPDNTIPHFIYSAQAGLELDPSFKASQLSPEHKNHIGAAAGYSPSQALGRLETCGKKCAENDASKFDGSATPIHGQPHLLDRLCSLLTTLTRKKYHFEKQTFLPKNRKTKMDNCWTWINVH